MAAVELFSVREVQVLLGLITCEGCDVVGSDHAPQAGVAQGVGHGPLVGRSGGHQEGLEGEQQTK